QLVPSNIVASSYADDSVDNQGNRTTFAPQNAVDGQLATAWRVKGDGRGEYIELQYAALVRIRTIKIVPGYAKKDPKDGTDRFLQNRRVSKARITFSDGENINITLEDQPTYQTFNLPEPKITTSVRITIEETIEPSSDNPRDYTPISEIALIGEEQQ